MPLPARRSAVRHPATRPAAVVVSLAAALVLAACSSGTDPGDADAGDATPVTGGTLTYASGDAEPTCLDPHVGGNYPQALVATQFLEPLVGRDSSGEITPWLATDWEVSDDGLTWDFTLADDVFFHDGTPLDAASVQASIEHLQDPATASSTGYLAVAKVESVEPVDTQHVRFHLSAPDSALLESLSQPWTAIQAASGLARSQEENCAAPIGTGPFQVTDWVTQDHVELTRYEGYTSPPADAEHDGAAYLDRIVWRFIPDSATRYAALVAGDVDVIDNAQPDTIAQAENDDAIEHLDAPRPGSVNRLELNSGRAPFDDVRVREAFLHAAEVDPGIESLFFSTATRSHSPLSSVESMAVSDEDPLPYDPDAAAALLDEAGWVVGSDGVRVRDGERLTVRIPVSTNQSIPAEVSLLEQIQASAREVGFDVQLDLLDLSSWYAALAADDYEAVTAPYTKVGPDVLRILYHSDGIVPAPSGYFANLSQVALPELDALLDEASLETDTDARAQLYAEAQRLVLEGRYILPLYDQQNHFLYRSDVRGLRALATVSTPTFADAWLAQG
ncbi:extracellular solute-binding protein family 5 [Beutenbergia cavernae DSM 12333]|uniref:Extracellular solute-binding protein family 5 n=1 Tax=Beutenbergia cavernae (strain ATCC BAA-8 / DSM 12333 / CCUG 43141 / JCM 11478 / NBRC 16432 / NCIMB 13614 / HKI 0122) TaxID=471853 RepID=C5C2B5_BEUC1|nr:ABC transporter substrate-binding protein [Beutenbergia cavernae]ACQ81740.1 extracellular solute-binding protein family 5 [Beutenbergia cavernae DSM 12333]